MKLEESRKDFQLGNRKAFDLLSQWPPTNQEMRQGNSIYLLVED